MTFSLAQQVQRDTHHSGKIQLAHFHTLTKQVVSTSYWCLWNMKGKDIKIM